MDPGLCEDAGSTVIDRPLLSSSWFFLGSPSSGAVWWRLSFPLYIRASNSQGGGSCVIRLPGENQLTDDGLLSAEQRTPSTRRYCVSSVTQAENIEQ